LIITIIIHISQDAPHSIYIILHKRSASFRRKLFATTRTRREGTGRKHLDVLRALRQENHPPPRLLFMARWAPSGAWARCRRTLRSFSVMTSVLSDAPRAAEDEDGRLRRQEAGSFKIKHHAAL